MKLEDSLMLDRVKRDTISILSRVQIRTEEEVEAMERQRRASTRMKFQHAEAASVAAGAGGGAPATAAAQATGGRPGPVADPQTPFVRDERKVGRNEPCPCGSGKKYKRCHGRLA